MSKKKIIISIVVLVAVVFLFSKIFNPPEEFQVEDVMIDRGSGEF